MSFSVPLKLSISLPPTTASRSKFVVGVSVSGKILPGKVGRGACGGILVRRRRRWWTSRSTLERTCRAGLIRNARTVTWSSKASTPSDTEIDEFKINELQFVYVEQRAFGCRGTYCHTAIKLEQPILNLKLEKRALGTFRDWRKHSIQKVIMAGSEATASGKTILYINGPNLNLLGTREPQIYGSITLPDIEASIKSRGEKLGITVLTYQSNHEGAIVDRIQEARTQGVDAIVINPAAYTHTSVAIRDALLGVAIPFIECHISNVHSREPWRHHSYFHDKAQAVIAGLGAYGYVAALEYWVWKFGDGPMKGI